MSFVGRWHSYTIRINSLSKPMHIYFLLKFLLFGSFWQLKGSIFLRRFDSVWLHYFKQRSVDWKQFFIFVKKLGFRIILGANNTKISSLWNDFFSDTCLAERVTTSTENSGRSLLAVLNAAKGTWELSFHRSNVLIISRKLCFVGNLYINQFKLYDFV